MLSLFLVLALILGTINIINYHNIVQDADETLAILQENQGEFPMDEYHQMREPGDNASGQNPPAKP